MAFIGIVTNEKNIQYMLTNLKNIFDRQKVIFINDNNIEHLQNIKFETIAIDCEINNIMQLKKLISNANYLILNADIEVNGFLLEDINLMAITYGFKGKATITVSSVSENNIIICLQRIIKTAQNGKYEPQEINIEIKQNIDIHGIICTHIIKLFYEKSRILCEEK